MNGFKTTKIVVDNVGQQNARDFWKQFDNMQEKINNLQSKIDKAIEWLDYENMGGYFECPKTEMKELLDILKEDK